MTQDIRNFNNTGFIVASLKVKLYNKSIDFLNENNEKYAIMQLKKSGSSNSKLFGR